MVEMSRAVALLRACVPDLQGVYVFGSTARGDATAGSDVDVAMLAAAPLGPMVRWELQSKLAEALGVESVDLVDLRQASTVMRVEVLRSGRLLFDGDRYARELFEAHALSDYARLNEERGGILKDVQERGRVHG